MTDSPRVLIVAEDDRLAGPLASGLDRLGWPARIVRAAEAAIATAAEAPLDAVLVDLSGAAPAAADAARTPEARQRTASPSGGRPGEAGACSAAARL